MEPNPFQPSSSPESLDRIEKAVVPHTASVRAEAWRGFKFGARITFFALSAITSLALLAGLVGMIFTLIVTRGEYLSENRILEQLQYLGGMAIGLCVTSFYGGIVGALIMVIAALVRKRRARKQHEKTE